jgi:hypothetical protein
MKTIEVYQSVSNPAIEAQTSTECLYLAEANPGNPDYLQWILILKVVQD